MKYKKYSYLVLLILMLMVGIDSAYAANEKKCYYISSNNDFKATLEISEGKDTVYIDKNNATTIHDKENINNWTKSSKSKGGIKFDEYYKNDKAANADANLSCPKYLVFQDCALYSIFATESKTLAENAVNSINKEKKCQGYYAISGYSAEEYYGSFADLTPGGTEATLDCDTLFGDPDDDGELNDIGNDGVASLSYLINTVMSYVRIIVPILVILLGMIDLSKAVLAAKEDEMRKAQITFAKRLIIGVCVFFAPLLVNIIMSLAEIVWEGLGYSSCNINL